MKSRSVGVTKKRKVKKLKVAVFIDAANILYSQIDLGWQVDYKKLIKYFGKLGELVFAGFYYGVVEKNEGQKRFLEMLADRGYTLRTKPVKFIKTKQGIIKKGNLDVEIAFDMLKKQNEFDVCILMSGDSDFEVILEEMKSLKKTVIIYSMRGHVAKELIRVADKYVPLEKIKGEVQRKNHPDTRSGDVHSEKNYSKKKRK